MWQYSPVTIRTITWCYVRLIYTWIISSVVIILRMPTIKIVVWPAITISKLTYWLSTYCRILIVFIIYAYAVHNFVSQMHKMYVLCWKYGLLYGCGCCRGGVLILCPRILVSCKCSIIWISYVFIIVMVVLISLVIFIIVITIGTILNLSSSV